LEVVTRRFLVFGKVQGVYFRHSARLEAKRLLLRGIARNLPDGSVEVLAQGRASAVDELRTWLQRGPAQARVEEVRETVLELEEAVPIPKGFEVF
jgi:acylphosphatase